MHWKVVVALLVQLPLVATACAARPAIEYSTAGRDRVVTEEGSVTDRGRARDIPYLLFRPAELEGRHPVVIFSHGNGGTRRDGTYLGEHLASHGYIVVHVQHAGSDAAIWSDVRSPVEVTQRMKTAAADRLNHDRRYRDIPAILDELATLDRQHPVLAGHLDLDAIGMSGHSWGALTTLVLAGARDGLDAPSYKDRRIKAAIALSPSLPRVSESDLKLACRDLSIPMLHVTGTRDASPVVEGLHYEKRLGPYKSITAPNQHLLILEGADHMLFPGVDSPLRTIAPEDEPILQVIKAVSLAFWDSYLRHDAYARQWLTNTYAASGNPVIHTLASK